MLVRRRKPERTGEERTADDADAALVLRAAGDPAAFEPLFRRYWDAVFRFCFYRLDSREEAEDAANQIFTNAYLALGRFRDRQDSFRSWLFTIAYNEVANRRRALARHPAGRLDDEYLVVDPSSRPDEQAVEAGALAETRALLVRLPDRPRRVAELRLAGLTDREIAQVLGMSHDAVRKAQSRAVAHLRELMGIGVAGSEATDG